MNNNTNLKIKNDVPIRPEKWQLKLIDRLSAILEMSDSESLIKDSLEARTARLKVLKASLEMCDIKPAGIESFANCIVISWIPRELVLCETYDQYKNLCLGFSNYINAIKEVKLKISSSVIDGDCNYYDYEVDKGIEYLEPNFSKDIFNYPKEIVILKCDYKIDECN